jgi:hypothetical protein
MEGWKSGKSRKKSARKKRKKVDLKQEAQIDKLEAARRQLDCAIRLYFNNEDSLSIHTIAYAAFRVLFDIYPRWRSDGLAHHLNKTIESKVGWRNVTDIPNFLKHADKDHIFAIQDHSYDSMVMEIGFAILLYSRLAGRYTAEMKAFDDHVQFLHPEFFNIPTSDDPELYRRYREAVEFMKDKPHEVKVLFGNSRLKLYRDNPTHPQLTTLPILD